MPIDQLLLWATTRDAMPPWARQEPPAPLPANAARLPLLREIAAHLPAAAVFVVGDIRSAESAIRKAACAMNTAPPSTSVSMPYLQNQWPKAMRKNPSASAIKNPEPTSDIVSVIGSPAP